MLKRLLPLAAIVVLLSTFMVTSPVAAESHGPSTASGTDYYCFPANSGPTAQPSVKTLWKGVALQTCRFVANDQGRLTGVNNIKIWAKFNLQGFPGTGDGVGTTTVQNGSFVKVPQCTGESNCYVVLPNQGIQEFYLFTPNGNGWEGAFTSKLVVEAVAPPYDVIATSSSTAVSIGTGGNKRMQLQAVTKVTDQFPNPLSYPVNYTIFGGK